MSGGWIVIAAFVAFAGAALLWLAGRWLASSWEVLDDDQLHEKLGLRGTSHAPAVWLRVRGWFSGGPRRLTYRRDKLGRFRKIRR
ncbi:MAG TPA: hypothetical protein VFS49_10535 [Croceibacterium sp.]|nr:hypothetical protein [Croceibacterium sp.]